MRKVSKTNRILSLVLCICMVLSLIPAVPLVAEAATTPTYIASIGIAQDKHESDAKHELSGHTIINRDLNEDAGGDYIYMGYKTTTDPSKAITGIFIRSGKNPPASATFDGVTAYLVGGSNEANTGVDDVVDLNDDAGGSYLYVYVTRNTSRAPITDITFSGSNSKSGYTTPNVNLNEGAGGSSIYLHYKQFSATVSATYHYLTANGSRTSSTQSATVKHHQETMTKVPSYPSSVTYDGKTLTFQGWREDDTADAATTTSPSATYMTGKKTYRAVYSATLTLSYGANGGSGAPSNQWTTHYINAGSTSVVKGSWTFTIPDKSYSHPAKCSFLGWSTNQSATTATYSPGNKISIDTNTTLYAVWKGEHTAAKTYVNKGTNHTYNWPCCGKSGTEAHSYTHNLCVCGAVSPDAVASVAIGQSVSYYATLNDAIQAAANCTAADKAVVTILKDIALGNRCQKIESGVFTLDLNGFEIKNTSVEYGALYLSGASVHVTLRDSGETGKITGISRGSEVQNGSTLTMSGGTITGSSSSGVLVAYDSTAIISGGTITATGSGSSGVVVAYDSTAIISGGTITAGEKAVYVARSGMVTISGGSVTGGKYGVHAYDISTAIISGGTITGSKYDVGRYEDTSTLKLTVGEDGVGATFPGGIEIEGSKLNAILGDGVAYWAGNTMLSTAEGAVKISDKGDITIKAKCTHKSGVKNYTDNGDDHTYRYSCCNLAVIESHSYADGICESCGNVCTHSSYTNGFCTGCDSYQPATGSGTESDPYKIGNAGQLYWFAAKVNGGKSSAWAELTADIVVNENVLNADGTLNEGTYRVWTPMGDIGNKYTGTFDGKGYTVSGLYFNDSAANYVGLFGYVWGGTVQNVGVVGSYLSGGKYVGGVVGYNYNSTVTNCYNSGTVSGSGNYVGGVVGYNYYDSTVTDCYNNGAVSGSSHVGGVVGENYDNSIVTDCYNNEAVSGISGVGGVVGYNYNNITVTDCYNNGAVSGSNGVGGVVGENYDNSIVTNCYNSGTVTDCYNSGTVSGSSNYVGGVVGRNSYNSTVTNCHNTGTVSGSRYVGGVVGENYDNSIVTDCYNSGTVSGVNYVGGVVGENQKSTVTNCYNSGTVSGSDFVGGVVGENYDNSTVTNCHNTGTVSGGSRVGGVVGYNYNNSTVTNCYNTGTVSGSWYVGGVVGINEDSTVTNCYYDSTVCSADAIGYNDDGTVSDVMGKTTEQFASGEVAYLLQGEQTEQVWGQNIDGEEEKDAYPVFSDAKVYQILNCNNEPAGYSNTESDALGHDWTDADCDTPKTCTGCGTTEGEALGHDWTDADCDTPKTCNRCGKTEGDALGHDWTDADCNTPKTCNRCGTTEGEALGHSWNDATCTDPKTCSVCGETEGETLGHKLVDRICTVCNKMPLRIEMTNIDATGWNGNAIRVCEDGQLIATVTLAEDKTGDIWYYLGDPNKTYEFYWVKGDYCGGCGFAITIGDETVMIAFADVNMEYADGIRIYPACEEHDYQLVKVHEPTCDLWGYTLYVCTVCGESKEDDHVPSLGHTTAEDAVGVVTPPTCENDGYTTYECDRCGESFNTLYVPALPHTLGEDGLCSVCGQLYTVPVWVAGIQIDANNLTDVLGDGTVSYDPSANVLTLNGFAYEGTDAGIYTTMSVNIVLLGENTIYTEYYGILSEAADGEITIRGTGNLTINSDTVGIEMYHYGQASLVIGGSVTVSTYAEDAEGIDCYSETGEASVVLQDHAKVILGTQEAPLGEECVYVKGFTCGSFTIEDNASISGITTDEEGIYVGGDQQFIVISDNASVNICADEEALDANTVRISGGTVTAIGGVGNEGIYTDELIMTGGTVTVSTAEVEDRAGDGVEADCITITGGTLKILSGGLIASIGGEETDVPGTITLGEGVVIASPAGAVLGQFDLTAIGEGMVLAVLDAEGNFADSLIIQFCVHEWADADCDTPKTCILCGETEGEPLGHSYTAAYSWDHAVDTCTATGTCSGCGDVQTETVQYTITVVDEAYCYRPRMLQYDADFTSHWAEDQTARYGDSDGPLDPNRHGSGYRYVNNGDGTHDVCCYFCGALYVENVNHCIEANIINFWEGHCMAQGYIVYKCPDCGGRDTVYTDVNSDIHAAGTASKPVDNGDGTHTMYYPCCNTPSDEILEHTFVDGFCACGAQVCEHEDADNSGRCDVCGVLMQPAKPIMISVSMKGNIGVNYYMLLSDEVLADATAYMQFTLADGEIRKVPVSEGVKRVYDSETYYVFTCNVDAKEMTDDILCQFFYDGGSTQEYRYSVQTYANHILSSDYDEASKNLIKAMVNYGAASQLHFGYNTDKLANAELETPDYSGVTIQGFNAVSGQGTDLAKFYSASLILKSETTLRFFFTAPITAIYNGQELEVKERSGLYYVDVVGISAKDLDENVTITINDGTNTADVTFNPMTYCQIVQNDTTGTFDQGMKDLVSALYLYNQAANVYFKEN